MTWGEHPMAVELHPIVIWRCEAQALHRESQPIPLMKKQSISQKILHQAITGAKAVGPDAKPAKRENTFSQSRDTREDRGTRQAKTTLHPQSKPTGR